MRTSGSIIKTVGGSQVFSMKITDTAEQMVVIFGIKNGDEELEKFSYPVREEWKTITKSGQEFTFSLSEDATAAIKSGMMVADVKAWYADGQNKLVRLNLCYITATYVSEIEKVE